MSSFSAILPIFRGPFLERIGYGEHCSTLRELIDEFRSHLNDPKPTTLGNWFECFYSLLLEKYRCEYVYKNALSTSLYLNDRHLPGDSFLISELRVGNSRADVAIFNGTSTVYEVKSYYDSFERLEAQIADYRKVFDRVYVVTTTEKVSAVLDQVQASVGVMKLEDDMSLTEEREAQSNKANTDPATIFNCMRQSEFCSAIKDAMGYIPDVPGADLYLELKKLFCQLDPIEAHNLMVEKVRARGRRQPAADLILHAPPSLKHACLSFSKSHSLASKIREKLKEPLLL